MIREQIEYIIKSTGTNKGDLCRMLGITQSNLSAFLKGHRNLPQKHLILILEYFGMTIGVAKNKYSPYPPTEIRFIITERMHTLNVSVEKLAAATRIHFTEVYRLMNGECNMSTNQIEKILISLGLNIVKHKM